MMKRFFSLAVASMLVVPQACLAADTTKAHRILILLNCSAAMNSAWQGASRYAAATAFITGLTDKMYERNINIEIGMAVYGAQYSLEHNRCNDYRREAAFERDNRTRLELRLADIQPKGKGSFNYAIAQAMKQEMTDTAKYRYSIVVVSDSSMQCGSDYCAMPTGMPLYRTYFAGVGNVPEYNCYSRRFQLTDRDAIAKSIHEIVSDFPEMKQEGEYWGHSRAIITHAAPATHVAAKAEDAAVTPALPRPTTSEISIRRGNQLYTITLYKRENGVFKKMEELFFYGEQVKKMKLPFGHYKASYYIDTKEIAQEFVVTEGSTVDVMLD
jgi:hypothetical protein